MSVIDISRAEEVKVSPVKLRIRRNRFKQADNTADKISDNETLVNITDPDSTAEMSEISEAENQTVKNTDKSISLSEIEETDWGDYDPDKIVDILMAFCNKIAGPLGLITYQKPVAKRIFRSIVRNEGATITLMQARQSGKSHTLGAVCNTLAIVMPALAKIFPDQLGMYRTGFLIGIYAPTGDKGRAIWDRASVMARQESMKEVYEDPEIDTSLKKHGLSWTNGSRLFSAPANERANPESKTHHFIVVDEAQDMRDGIIEGSIEPMLAFTNGTMCLIGIPPVKRNYFDEMIEQNIQRAKTGEDRDRKHFEYNYEEIIKYLPQYKRHIAQMISKHGIDSPYFRRHYNLERMYEKGQAVLDSDFKTYMMYDRGKSIIPSTDLPVVVSIDVAKENDSTVVTVGLPEKVTIEYDDTEQELNVLRILNWFEITNMDYTNQRHHIKNFLSGYRNIQVCVVDTTGVGSAFLEGARREWGFIRKFVPFVYSAESKEKLMGLFYEYFWSRRLQIPSTHEARKTVKWQRFYLQMMSLQILEGKGRKFLGKRDGANNHDDYAQSLFMNIYGAEILSGITSTARKDRYSFFDHENASPLYQRSIFVPSAESIRESRKSMVDKRIKQLFS